MTFGERIGILVLRQEEARARRRVFTEADALAVALISLLLIIGLTGLAAGLNLFDPDRLLALLGRALMVLLNL